MPEITATQTAADMTYAKPHEFMPSGRQNRRAARAQAAALRWLVRIAAFLTAAVLVFLALPGPGTFALDNGWKIEITETICPDLPAQEEYEWDIAQNTVTFPLVLRSRQAGDQLRLPGRRTKTLKKWYIDEKIPRQNRQSLPVLADESGLLAAAGLGPNYPRLAQPGQPALHIRLTPKTKPEERT